MFVHILSSAIVTTGLMLAPAAGPAKDHGEPTMNIVETAVSAGSFSTLVAAVEAAGLVEVLSGEGPYTVFAPTDEAFAQIPATQLKALLADKEALTAVLTYHVLPGKIMASEVVELESAATVNGEIASIRVVNGTVMIDDAHVTSPDIEATNGVIHVIDRVILPQG